ncbi:arsenical pump-driving ATPase [Guptibacillus hwajinpoensis]|uniref:Arsenic ABC transporter ATPase n=1 Tax=Guptibacillus hwajinpoensis TaxID=208199 RepID=A0A0J6FUG4_9BACL|nr:arsenical pump-driving ATPase [Alkalihalobacillus macyae]KMM37997.1 arsenic ABC transporter ATPase [Alkalihalobacillus macyae]
MYQSFNPNQLKGTPFLFFTGKGGVGKTSTACATAIYLADTGKKVLLVSTDPASNLQDVLEVELTNAPKPVPNMENLHASNIDPEQAAADYREKVVGPYRDQLPQAAIKSMEEQLSGACTVEMAAFDEFSAIIANSSIRNQYDHIIFDTAPTGHTLRLLQLPTAWNEFLNESTHGASCLGPLSGLQEKKQLYEQTVNTLSNKNLTALILIARPETSSLYEAERSSRELKEIGIKNQLLIMNGLLKNHLSHDEVSSAFHMRQQKALESFPEGLKQVVVFSVPFVSYSLTGIENLRHLFKSYTLPNKDEHFIQKDTLQLPGLNKMVNHFSDHNQRVILTMGKGGVGKTTVAASIAVGLVEKGHKVHLTTTDPAAHLEYTFGNTAAHENLSISSIDPKSEVEAYKKRVLAQASGELNEAGIAYLKEDLDSPCTEEIAVFRAFAEQVDKCEDEIVVIDTAPTGHTLLLLDSAEEYHKEISKSTGDVPQSVKRLLPRLRNAEETSVVIVTLAETTPVLEAERLQRDLTRAHIQPAWWVINQSLHATVTQDPVLSGRAQTERKWIEKVKDEFAQNTVIIPWISEEKIGYEEVREYMMEH